MMATCSGRLVLLLFVGCSLLVDTGQMGTQEGTSGDGLAREKREVATAKNGFNNEEKEIILQRHNYFRTLPGASNMLKMDWDSELEKLAQSYANKCVFEHNEARKAEAFTSVGENLYVSTATFEPAAVVQYWYDEVTNYRYASNTCKKGAVCGHYKQVVWADSLAVGCGVKYCERLRGAEQNGISEGYIVVCNYGPSGNYKDEKPYKTGKLCSLCPKDRKYCVQGLCSTSP